MGDVLHEARGITREHEEEGEMRTALRRRFWAEGAMAVVTAVLFVATLIQPDWIEEVLHLDPDAGNGSVEWLIVGALAVVTVGLIALAGSEWRRAAAVA
jgi:hypothetical protein